VSISRTVYSRRSALLTPRAWAEAIRAEGFPLELDPDFDVEKFSGYLPCRFAGRDSGFEYYCSPQADAPPEAGDRDVAISFVTHSSLRELATAVVAAAVLCARVDGVLHDEESDEFSSAADAVSGARALLAELGPDLD
jgi:hypothetical protein